MVKLLDSVKKLLQEKIDITNKKTLTFILAGVIILFAIVYVYQSRKILEGFASYSISGPTDTVLLGSLDKVRVGTATNQKSLVNTLSTDTELINALTTSPDLQNYVQQEINTKIGNLASNDDLITNINGLPKFSDVNAIVDNKLVNYLKKNDIINSTELDNLITLKINAYNTQAQAYVNAQVQQTIPNINSQIKNIENRINGVPKLIGIINYKPNKDMGWADWGQPGAGKVVLGTDNGGKEITVNTSEFTSLKNTSFGLSVTFADTRLYAVCCFDWIYSKNILFWAYSPIANNCTYISTYPENIENGNLLSPFDNIQIKKNTKYLFNVSVGTRLMGNNFGFYYILYNTDKNTVNLVNICFTTDSSNKYTFNFVVETTTNTNNIGLYLVGLGGSSLQLMKNESAMSVTVSEL